MAMIKSSGGATPAAVAKPAKPSLYEQDTLTPLTVLAPHVRILLSGDTGAGKTTQIGELAEYIFMTTGKKTVLFTMDKGGVLPIQPYIDLGIIEVELWDGLTPPWIWIKHAVHGEAKRNGKWVKLTDPATVGLDVNEGLSAFSDAYMVDLARESAENPAKAVGGDSAWNFEVEADGEVMKLASNTQSHYGLAQLTIMNEILRANPGVPSLWTALLARSNDAYGGILGPQTAGKAQAAQVPRWFDFTFRLDARPKEGGVEHTLYTSTHMDPQARGSRVVANARLPLAGKDHKVEERITPASLVQALLQIQARCEGGKEEIRARMQRFLGKKA